MATSISTDKKFAQKVAIITGASSGIGRATAVLFSRLGAKLSVTGRNQENLAKSAVECEAVSPYNLKPLCIVGDLTIESDIERIVKSTIDTYGRLDILVNNAATTASDSAEDGSLATLDLVWKTNVRSVYHLTMLAVPHLIESKGSIVNVSSVLGQRGNVRSLSYTISKGALDQLTRSVALDLAPKQIRVNSVNPGVIETNMFPTIGLDTNEVMEKAAQSYPLGRGGQPQEVANAIAFLASHEASFITGETLVVDGAKTVSYFLSMATSRQQEKKLDQKVALITGASSGIGRATAVLFSSLGARLALTGRNQENLTKSSLECETVSPYDIKPLCIVGDLTIESDIERIVNSTTNTYGRLDILVNNAGIIAVDSAQSGSLETLDLVWKTNVRSVYHLTMLAVPHLIESKGSIVNVSSILSKKGYATALSYTMSKGALDQFTRSVAIDLGPKHVRVNSVNPTTIETNIYSTVGLDTKEIMKDVARSYPLGRGGQPEEVASAIAFLASDEASFISGETLVIDGARLASC
ncbi:putative short-chain type dehydrogenase/reductase y4vI [Tachypleus tridentatus]|uniref:putative short-chain type dehydrogenase/reductase y4vI n=1 Tax=Tachypleus tridentatus TaxID=6853 RepID=UPI003FD348A5